MNIIKKQTDAAEILGISQARFNVIFKSGRFDPAIVFRKNRNCHYDAEKLKACYLNTRSEIHSHREEKINTSPKRTRLSELIKTTGSTETGGISPDEKEKIIGEAGIKTTLSYNTARTLNEQYKAAMAKITYEKEIGKLLLAEQVEKKAFEAGRKIRDACLSIADRCAALVAAESDQFKCRQILQKEITYIMDNLSERIGLD